MTRGYDDTPPAATAPLRLFVALRLPAPVTAPIADATARMRTVGRVRWSPLRDLHVTLAFLGTTPAARVDDVAATLAASAARRPPLDLVAEGAGAFPSVHRPRVVWIGMAPAPALLALQSDVARGLRALGFDLDRRRFHPHITIGRVSREGPDPALEPEIGACAVRAAWRAERMSLMRSDRGPVGARHTEVASWPFARGMRARSDRVVGG